MHRRRCIFALLLLWQSASGFLRAGTCNTGRIAVAISAKGKKGKKGKKQKQQKKSGMDWARDFEVMPFDSSVLRPLADAAADADRQAPDTSLAGAGDLPKALYKAPVCVMVVSDEKIAYANDAVRVRGKKPGHRFGDGTAATV